MASLTSVTANPTTVATGGGTSKIVPVISDPDSVATVTVTLDGKTGTAQIDLHENLRFSVDPADEALAQQPGKGVAFAKVDQGGVLAVGSDGVSFAFTAG